MVNVSPCHYIIVLTSIYWKKNLCLTCVILLWCFFHLCKVYSVMFSCSSVNTGPTFCTTHKVPILIFTYVPHLRISKLQYLALHVVLTQASPFVLCRSSFHTRLVLFLVNWTSLIHFKCSNPFKTFEQT